MNETEFVEFTKMYDFNLYADITKNNDHAYYCNIHTQITGSGFVYFWVEKYSSNFNIVYIGKAGKTMKQRCDQHTGGFKGGSKTGKAHSDRIITGINNKKTYSVYARKAKTASILGEDNISLCCAEEISLIKKLNPPWNKIKT